MKNKKGFSLTELIAVVVIIGILVAIAIPVMNRANQNKKLNEHKMYYKTLIATINSSLDNERGFYINKKGIGTEVVFVPFGEWNQYKDDVDCLKNADWYFQYKTPNYACKITFSDFIIKYTQISNIEIEDMIDLNHSYIHLGLTSDEEFFLDSILVKYKNDKLKVDNESVSYFFYNYKKTNYNYERKNYDNGFYNKKKSLLSKF